MKRRRISAWGWLYRLHRYIGLVIAIIVLMLALTGITINHSDSLQLSKRMVESGFILDQYGIKAPDNPLSFKTNDIWVIQMGKKLFLNSEQIPGNFELLAGVVATNGLIACAFSREILVLSPDGDIVEQIKTVPGHIERIGADRNDLIYLKTAQGNYYSNDMLFSWKPGDINNIGWAESKSPPSDLIATIAQSYRSNILPLDRVLLDFHSGRFFGQWGVYIVDAASLLLVFLAISGSMIWLRHKFVSTRARYRKRKRNQSAL
ncbi:MAG: PepSY-associated TM helix domain-containing protein [Methylococcales bacterium]